jgi:Putative MetA-pathway of phenol degradation
MLSLALGTTLMSTKFIVTAAGAALLLAQPAFAHHPTGVGSTGGAGPINTISASPLDKGETAASIAFEWIKFDPLSNAFLANFGATHGHDVHVHSLSSIMAPAISFGYGLTADFTISARLPVVVRRDIKEAAHEHEDGVTIGTVEFLGDSAGIGDLTLLGQYRFYNNRATRTELALLLGVMAPTGVTDRHADTGELFDAEFQPGSGSWDGLFGAAVTKRIGPWSFDANVLYVLVTEGTQNTDLGDRFLYNVGVSYRLMRGSSEAAAPMKLGALPDPMWHGGPGTHRHSHVHQETSTAPSLDLVLELNGEWHAKQVESGVTDPNSGGNTLFLAPGLRYSRDNWSSFLSVGIPIINGLNGIQAEPEVRVLTGVSVTF